MGKIKSECINYFDSGVKCPHCDTDLFDCGFYDVNYINYLYDNDKKKFMIDSYDTYKDTEYACGACGSAIPIEVIDGILVDIQSLGEII